MLRIRFKVASVWIGIASVAIAESPNLSFCLVHHRSQSHVYRGWEHVVSYWNKTYGGINVGGNTSSLQLKMNLIDGDSPQPNVWWDKWGENVAWGCKVALVQSDTYPFADTAAYLEDRGLIVMLASGARWKVNPRTGSFWETVWNGAISAALYHESYLSALASQQIQKLCVINLKGWHFGSVMSADAANAAFYQYGINVSAFTFDHRKSKLDVQAKIPASLRDDVFVDPYHPNTWDFVLETCADADALLGYLRNDGLSLLNFLKAKNRVFKGIYLSNMHSYLPLATELANFVMAPAQWHESAASSCEIFGSNSVFVASFKDHYGSFPHYMAALTAFDAAVVLIAANRSNSLAVPQINKAIDNLENYNAKTFFGPVAWSRHNYNGRAPVLLQAYQSGLYAVFPASIASQPFILPAPTLEARRGCPEGKTGDKKIHVHGTTLILSCAGCPPGYALNLSQRAPVVPSNGLPCDACPAGKFADTSGMSSCSSCLPGSFSTKLGSQECSFCMPGKFADSAGAGNCKHCEVGQYSSLQGATSCEACPPTTTTRLLGSVTVANCVCPVQTYYFSNPGILGRCVKCAAEEQIGLQCPGGFAPLSDLATDDAVAVKESYMVHRGTSKLVVFQCQYTSVCLGDRHVFTAGEFNSNGMCTGLAEGIACARCPTETYRVSNGSCELCAGTSALYICQYCFILILFCLYMIHKTMLPPDPLRVLQVILLNFVLAIAVVVKLDIPYPATVGTFSQGSNLVLNVDYSTLSLPIPCIMGGGFLRSFSFALLVPILIVGGICFIFVVGHYGSPMTRKLCSNFVLPAHGPLRRVYIILDWLAFMTYGFPLKEQLGWLWPLTRADFVNAILTVFIQFFITIANLALSLVKFHTHPSGTRTHFNYRQVEEQSTDWFLALPISVVSLFLYVIIPFAFMTYIVQAAPRHFGDPQNGVNFRKSYRSLWQNFHPGVWWFGLAQMLYGLAINLTPVVFPGGRWQVMALIIMNTYAALVTIFVLPWRFAVNLISEIVAKIGLVVVLMLMMNTNLGETLDSHTLGILILTSAAIPVVFIGIQALLFIKSSYLNPSQIRKEAAEFGQRLHDVSQIIGARSVLDLRAYGMDLLAKDRYLLDRAVETVLCTMQGLQPKQYFRQRCVDVPFEVDTEGRLEGEIRMLGLQRSEDSREQIRKLRNALLRCTQASGIYSSNSVSSCRAAGGRDAIEELFTRVEGKLAPLTEATFAEAVNRCFSEYKNTTGRALTSEYIFSDEALTKVFRYCDYEQQGSISTRDFAALLWAQPEPVLVLAKEQSHHVAASSDGSVENEALVSELQSRAAELDVTVSKQQTIIAELEARVVTLKEPECETPLPEQHRDNAAKLQVYGRRQLEAVHVPTLSRENCGDANRAVEFDEQFVDSITQPGEGDPLVYIIGL